MPSPMKQHIHTFFLVGCNNLNPYLLGGKFFLVENKNIRCHRVGLNSMNLISSFAMLKNLQLSRNEAEKYLNIRENHKGLSNEWLRLT